ncbi:MAG TPA: LuxR C-terminal-related transcriptional regulator [Streptosporangiaceae bacterium]|nr:LuxR C-terminal-related transcriptional regulator [Streptosporangiaceae bacterium]
MAEPSAPPTAPRAVASERDALLATKLNVPGSRPGLVPRPRLSERLDEGLRRGPVLVCAPAGYGKTVLLAEWAQRGQVPAAWLSLDSGDNDPARFWRHAVAALDRVRPGIGGRVGPLLGPSAPPSFEPLLTALINELAAGPGGEVLLVLDDYHAIGSQPVHASVGFMLEHRPPGLHMALASRSDPPLALARLRARGQLTELRAADLRFTAGEATAAGPGIVEPLTGRELEVLELLASGRSNQAIASQLVVSLDTVKKHVGHVLAKLGAANRTEAVARARQLGPIP